MGREIFRRGDPAAYTPGEFFPLRMRGLRAPVFPAIGGGGRGFLPRAWGECPVLQPLEMGIRVGEGPDSQIGGSLGRRLRQGRFSSVSLRAWSARSGAGTEPVCPGRCCREGAFGLGREHGGVREGEQGDVRCRMRLPCGRASTRPGSLPSGVVCVSASGRDAVPVHAEPASLRQRPPSNHWIALLTT